MVGLQGMSKYYALEPLDLQKNIFQLAENYLCRIGVQTPLGSKPRNEFQTTRGLVGAETQLI
jgi:hypothetical protein